MNPQVVEFMSSYSFPPLLCRDENQNHLIIDSITAPRYMPRLQFAYSIEIQNIDTEVRLDIIINIEQTINTK